MLQPCTKWWVQGSVGHQLFTVIEKFSLARASSQNGTSCSDVSVHPRVWMPNKQTKKEGGKGPPLLRSLTTIMDVYWRWCFLLARGKSLLFCTVHISTMEWTMERQPKKRVKRGWKGRSTSLHRTTESHAREDRKVSLDNITKLRYWVLKC